MFLDILIHIYIYNFKTTHQFITCFNLLPISSIVSADCALYPCSRDYFKMADDVLLGVADAVIAFEADDSLSWSSNKFGGTPVSGKGLYS